MSTRQRAFLLGTASYLAVAVLIPRLGFAEVATDGTMGRQVTLRGGNIEIGADLGQQRGGNLFHSFRKFNVETKGRVAFTGPDSVKNVIGRVTGGEVSSIDGTLASTIPDADLYLINPAGILFGPNAQLDVKGSFHASTADELRLADGAVFSALDAAGSTLSVAEPQAFGFLGGNAGRIDVRGSTLVIRSGTTLGLSAAEIAAEGATLRNDLLSPPALGTAVAVAAQRGAGEVPVDAATAAVARDGTIRLGPDGATNPSGVVLTGPGGGRIRIEGGDIALDVASIGTFNLGGIDDSSGVDLAADSLLIRGQATPGGRAGGIVTSTLGGGRAGPVSVSARSITIDQGIIASTPLGAGGGGPIAIAADSIDIHGGLIGVPLFGVAGFGASADTRVTARTALTLDSGAEILSISGRDQAAGVITISSMGSVTVADNSRISADTSGTGAGGAISVNAEQVSLLDGGRITSTTNGEGRGGSVVVDADAIIVAGGTMSGEDFMPSGVRASTEGSRGNAGSVTIDTDGRVDLSGGGRILSATFGAGDGGTVTINAGSVSASGGVFVGGRYFPSGILVNAQQDSGGDAGSVDIDAPGAVNLTNGGQIVSATFGTGDGGTVKIDAGSVSASGGVFAGGRYFPSGILASAQQDSGGDAGSVDIDAPGAVNLTNGGQIVSATFGTGDGGTVKIDAGSVSASGRFAAGSNTFPSGVLASAEQDSRGDAGSVVVTAAGQLELGQNGVISSESRGDGAAGDIRLRAGRVESDRGAIRTAGAGAEGGTIDARASDRMVLRRTVVTSNGIQPQQGTSIITLAAPQIVLNASTVTSLTGEGRRWPVRARPACSATSP